MDTREMFDKFFGKEKYHDKKQSGLEDDPWVMNQCIDPSHNPPNMICIPQGKIYRHICPRCGKESILRRMNVTC